MTNQRLIEHDFEGQTCGLNGLKLAEIRDAVATALEARGLGNRSFIEEIRAGLRDDGPFMVGATAWATAIMRTKVDAPG
ncbi:MULTISPECIES: hypothetical protein [Sphingomonadaceae]|jgi:hypothetical protein|uniref:Uncharacterized protein n=1 Tax=Sphingomonas bisphenolicum TaxID=296544 RepID=A0ABM7G733_9SPHN|nr:MULTISPECIES: hypothetical protein [Sphingomonadaceae]BBF70551.1 hypothetical protein SBA_ch1_27510 [Sphingomonas bisphenolicum]